MTECEKQNTPAMFTSFPRLPAELRQQIWELAIGLMLVVFNPAGKKLCKSVAVSLEYLLEMDPASGEQHTQLKAACLFGSIVLVRQQAVVILLEHPLSRRTTPAWSLRHKTKNPFRSYTPLYDIEMGATIFRTISTVMLKHRDDLFLLDCAVTLNGCLEGKLVVNKQPTNIAKVHIHGAPTPESTVCNVRELQH
ncbi:hypothetical protein JX266_011466 [Neoarthrinium moseri]|nr:hypothetical protein JX266_011466 [Neoarthrinium moseri]